MKIMRDYMKQQIGETTAVSWTSVKIQIFGSMSYTT